MMDALLTNVDRLPFRMKAMDITYAGNGDFTRVEGVNLIDQMIMKGFLGKFGSDPVNPISGSAFSSMIGVKLNAGTSTLVITTETERVINRIAKITQSDSRFTPDQRIIQIQNIQIQQVKNKPTQNLIFASMVTASGNSITSQQQIGPNIIQ